MFTFGVNIKALKLKVLEIYEYLVIRSREKILFLSSVSVNELIKDINK